MDPSRKLFISRRSIRPEIVTNTKYDIRRLLTLLPYKLNIAVNKFFNKSRICQCNSLGVECSKTLKKIKIEGRTTYNLNTYSIDILILSPRRLFNAARAVSSISFSKQTSLKSTTSITYFLPKNNKVHVKLGIAHQSCLCALFRGITRASAISKMELFVTLLNGLQALTNVTKNSILDVVGVVGPSLLLYKTILFQNIDT